jgi:hypothetical protein
MRRSPGVNQLLRLVTRHQVGQPHWLAIVRTGHLPVSVRLPDIRPNALSAEEVFAESLHWIVVRIQAYPAL